MNIKSEPRQLLSMVKPNPDVIFRHLGDEIVLYHLGTDRFYELNGTAARFWELLNAGNDVPEVQEKMLLEFAIDPEQLSSEAEALLSSLRRENLISFDE